MNAIKSLYNRRDELKSQIEQMAGKKGVGQLRGELEAVDSRLSALDARRRQMKANVNGKNAVGRSVFHVERKRIALAELADAAIKRGSYDELHFSAKSYWTHGGALAAYAAQHPTHPNALPFSAWSRANATLSAAIEDGLIPDTDAEFDRKGRGTATNHDLYSYTSDGTLVLVQVRHAAVTKYGTSVKIRYFVTDGDDAIEIEKGKASIKKAAQSDPAPDSPLRFLRKQLKAEWQLKINDKAVKLAAPKATEYAVWKILHDDNGTLRSVYSGEEYAIGKSKVQKALDDHNGGYYAFLTAETAQAVHRNGNAFAAHSVGGKRLVLCKGRAFGKPVEYSSGKCAFSRMVIDEIVSVIE